MATIIKILIPHSPFCKVPRPPEDELAPTIINPIKKKKHVPENMTLETPCSPQSLSMVGVPNGDVQFATGILYRLQMSSGVLPVDPVYLFIFDSCADILGSIIVHAAIVSKNMRTA
jgi:hypothetical protein